MPSEALKTYTVSKKWKTIVALAAGFYLLAGCVLILFPFFYPPSFMFGWIVCLVMGSVIGLFSLYLILLAFKYRFEVLADRIRSVGIWWIKEWPFSEIEGFELFQGSGKEVTFLSTRPGRKMRVYPVFEDGEEFERWVKSNFKNLSNREEDRQLAEALQEAGIVLSEAESQERRKKLVRRMLPAFLILLVAFYWGFIHPRPYGLFIAFGVLTPFLTPILRKLYPAHFRFNVGKKSHFVPVELFMMPGIALLGMRAVLDWDIWEWSRFWFPCVVLSLALAAPILRVATEFRGKKVFIFQLLFFCAAYGAGATVCLNGYLDASTPQPFVARVMDKRDNPGRPHSYYMKLSVSSLASDIREFQVGRQVYEQAVIGGPATVLIKQGAFHIPHYSVR